jgi:hypothetical protein
LTSTSKDAAVPLPRVTVLASAFDAFRVTDGLRAAGLGVEYWSLPAECSGPEAAVLSELASADEEWAARLSSTQVLLTVFRNPQILPAVVIPHVLPYLSRGTLWLQMGAVAGDADSAIQKAAAQHGLRLLNMPLAWNEGGSSIQRTSPAGAENAHPRHEPDADLLYGLALAALTAPGLGPAPALHMSPRSAETLTELERAMGAPPPPQTHQQQPGLPAFEPLSESAICDLEFKQLVQRSDLPHPHSARERNPRDGIQRIPHHFDPTQGVNTNRQVISGFNVADIGSAPLKEISPGQIWTARLAGRDGLIAELYVFAPGAEAGEDLHLTTEFGFVIDGELKDEYGTYPAGSLWVAVAGTAHHPRSETGARVLIVQSGT